MSGVRTDLLGEPDIETHQGFLLSEDEALKTYFTGLTVPERPGSAKTMPVGVWFRWPEGERQIKYPFITLDLIDVAPAYDLWTSEYVVDPVGLYQPDQLPLIPPPPQYSGYQLRPYLAFRLAYQVSVHSRSALHDRYLNSLFFTDILPPRPFWMGVDTDNTWRRCDLVDFAQADMSETTESGSKRIFRKVYTISMLAEIPQSKLVEAWQALRVFVAVTDLPYMDNYVNTILKDERGDDILEPLTEFTQEERAQEGELTAFKIDYLAIYPTAAEALATTYSPSSPSGS